MNKLDTIKEKMQKKTGFGEQVNKFIKTVEKEAEKKVIKSVQGKVLENVSNLIQEVQNLLSTNTNSYDGLIKYLEEKAKEVKNSKDESDRMYKSVLAGLSTLAKQTQKVYITNPEKNLTKAQIREAFSESLKVVEKIIAGKNQVPESGAVKYNGSGRIETITENYGSYTIRTSILYTADGKVSSWKSVKV
jgi:ABC-type transporter Mla subunit MlaD